MKYDKIRGRSVSECMMKLRERFGSSAIILATREVKEGGLFGTGLLASRLYEIDYMIEEGKARGRNSPPAPQETRAPHVRPASFKRLESAKGSASRPGSDPGARSTGPAPAGEDPLASSSAEELLALLNLADENETRGIGEPGGISPGIAGGRTNAGLINDRLTNDGPAIPSAPSPSIASENFVQRESSSDAARENVRESRPAYYHKIRSRLSGARLSRDFIEHFLKRLDHSLSGVEKEEYQKVEEKSLEQLSRLIRTTPDIAPPQGECRAVMLIGPTGSGKTTSLAKLAARYHIFQDRDVSLYSLDHYRLAATEQLKTYADVMGVPFHAPLNPVELGECILRDGSELILIDTSGISHKDLPRIRELKDYAEACEVRLEKHLVIAANTSPDLIEKILLAFDTAGFDKIILTKLDETDFIGAFIEHADKFNRPFSFMTNGQEVPGDILKPEPMDIARMVLRTEILEGGKKK